MPNSKTEHSRYMGKLKKLPLFIGLLFIVIWGANKKMNLQIENSNNKDYVFLKQLNKINTLPTASWEEFYQTARPLLSHLISDSELRLIYYFLQDSEQEHFDSSISKKDKLEALLILFTLKLNSKDGNK